MAAQKQNGRAWRVPGWFAGDGRGPRCVDGDERRWRCQEAKSEGRDAKHAWPFLAKLEEDRAQLQ